MAHNEDDFRIHPGKVRDRGRGQITARRTGVGRGRPTSFVGEVNQAIRRAGGNPNRLPGTGKGAGRFNARGRGAAAAQTMKDRSAWSRDRSGARTRARRVAVKARVVKLNPQRGAARGRQFVSAKAVDAHLRYLERDGVTKDGAKGQVYSTQRDTEDGRAFLDRGRNDRLLYLSPERIALDGTPAWLGRVPVSFFAIDEAHCISEWGHDFRPEYRQLSRLRELFPDRPIALFSIGDVTTVTSFVSSSRPRREQNWPTRAKPPAT